MKCNNNNFGKMKLNTLISITIFCHIICSFFTLSTEEMKFRHKKLKFHKKTIKSRNLVIKQYPSNTLVDKNTEMAKNTDILNVIPDPYGSVLDLNLGQGPVYYSGWVKYFKYSSDEIQKNKPSSFFKNLEFYNQQKSIPNEKLQEKIGNEYKYIKNESLFYIMIFFDSINLLNSKINKFGNTYDSLFIDLITPQVEDTRFIGGISDFGSFSEGFCFKIQTSKKLLIELPQPGTPITNWIFCTETAQEKANLMTILRKIKIKRQRDQGTIFNSVVPIKESKVGDMLSGKTLEAKQNNEGDISIKFNSTTDGITDGYWITLQTWTQCSLKCGGGLSTLHRMCVPPKNGGKACSGPTILTKPCNTQPCPEVKKLLSVKNLSIEKEKVHKPIVKVMAFSDRPQRYSKCIVKEADMLYSKILTEKVQYVENVQLPVRLVMNNKTISIFGSSDYDSVIVSFQLEDTNISPSKLHKTCFILSQGEISENIRQAELCPFGMDGSEKVFQEWMYDFNLFKYQCRTERETIKLENSQITSLEEKLKKKVSQAKLDIVQDQSNLLKNRVQLNDEKKLSQQLIKTNVLAMTAIQKELSVEEMVKKEEEEREKLTEKELLEKINEEKEKHLCMLKKIEEKKKEDQYNIKNKEAESELQRIRDQAKNQLMIKRSQLRSDILKMRKKAERKKSQLLAQLQSVRIQMSKDMNVIYKDGDMNRCKLAMKNDDERKNYCEGNFPDNYVNFDNCKNDEDFCYFCCESEFGNMHMDKRQTCYDTICSTKSNIIKNKESGWLWVSNLYSIPSDNTSKGTQ